MRRLSVLVLVLAIGVAARPIEPPSFSFPRSTPEAQGISSAAILPFVEEAEQKLDALHSIMIVRHGQVVAEGWWAPYAANEPHMLYSLSKSFTSTAVGLAVAEGKLSVDDPVLNFFPDEAPARAERQPQGDARARSADDVHRTSRRGDRDFPYSDRDSVVKKVPRASGRAQAGHVLRLQHAGDLHAVGDRAEGDRPDRARLPRSATLRAARHRPTRHGNASKQGISLGGFGLSVRTEDIARFGQLYLQKGKWHGKQLVPAAWVETATSRHASNGSSPTSDWEQGYGYQFWRSRHGLSRRRRARAVLPRAAAARRGDRDHQRHARHGVGHEPRLGPLLPAPSSLRRCRQTPAPAASSLTSSRL